MRLLSSIKLGRKSREDSLHPMWAWFIHSTHTHTHTKFKAELTIQCKTDSPTLPLHSYPPCTIQFTCFWGENVFSLPQILISQLSSVSPDLKGGMMGQRSPNTAERQAQPMQRIRFILVTSGQTYTHNQAHCKHQDSNTHHKIYFLRKSSSFLVCLQVVFDSLTLIGCTLMFLWFLLRPTSCCQKYCPATHSNKSHDIHFYCFSISPPPI